MELGAKMVPFAGYEMPVQYPTGIKTEHLHTREKAGLFDISHMGQVLIKGDEAATWLETLVPGDICGLEVNRQRYTMMTNESAGIIDDLMVSRLDNGYFLVLNAACKEKDVIRLQNQLPEGLVLTLKESSALLALQGPLASTILSHYDAGIADMPFMSAGRFSISTIDCLVHRCGYTGEDGFELSVSATQVEELARLLLANESVMPVGLGARDSLRLEAGLCLHGHDIDEFTSPIEAGLGWTVASKYKNGEKGLFPGAELIQKQLETGASIRLRGIRPLTRLPVREGVEILDDNNEAVGKITSGGFGPSADSPVALGYIQSQVDEDDRNLHVVVRGRRHDIETVTLPFIQHNYYKGRRNS
jgi:aminomethyltransferase